MPATGIVPVLYFYNRILSPARLPVPPRRHFPYVLPKLNYEGSEKLYDDIMRVAAKWLSPPYNADGWRLDVAADLGHSPEMNHKFWRDFRKSVKTANPDAIILAEHYGDQKEWLQKGDQWDTVMNYDAWSLQNLSRFPLTVVLPHRCVFPYRSKTRSAAP